MKLNHSCLIAVFLLVAGLELIDATPKTKPFRSINCGVFIDPTNSNGAPTPEELKKLNVSWVRFEYIDDCKTPATPSQLAFYDKFVTMYNSAGINILMILDYMSLPGKPPSNSPPNEFQTYFDNWLVRVNAVVGHFGTKISAYEIWNEPDAAPSENYDPGVPPILFGVMLRSVYSTVRNVSDSIKVVSGGLSSGNVTWLSTMMKAAGNNIFADAVGIHPFGQRPYPDWPSINWGSGNLIDLLQNYLKVIQNIGIPLWITGIGTNDLQYQGEFPMKALSSVNTTLAAEVPVVIWFCYSDSMEAPFGLLAQNGSPKAAYYSLGEFAGLPFEPPADPNLIPVVPNAKRARN